MDQLRIVTSRGYNNMGEGDDSGIETPSSLERFNFSPASSEASFSSLSVQVGSIYSPSASLVAEQKVFGDQRGATGPVGWSKFYSSSPSRSEIPNPNGSLVQVGEEKGEERAPGVGGWSKYVVFIIGLEKERMFGLKSQLISKSTAFSEIVYSQKEVIHPEFKPQSFHIFLKYINNDELIFGESDVCDLFRLAFVYEIPHIMKCCTDFAIATLSLENCLAYHLAASLVEAHELQSRAFKFMIKNGSNFLYHPSFLELDPLTLGLLVGRDDFPILETELFHRLLDWVEAECARLRYPHNKPEFHRRVCGNFFQHVRFAMMTPKEFITQVLPYGILNQRDIDAIHLRHVTHPQLWHTLPPTQYLERPRMVRPIIRVPLYNSVQLGFRRISVPNAQESFRFLASKEIYFIGIEFFGPARNGPMTSYKIKYQIENEFKNFYFKMPTETVSILTPNDFEVELPHPYKIEGQEPYKLTVWLEGQISQYGLCPLPQAVLMLNNSQISIHFGDNASSKSFNFKTQQPSSPGLIKSLLFQTVD